METLRDLWRQRWLSSINELTSIDLQVSSWLNKENTNPHWSFVEFSCCYFDDLVLDDNYESLIKDGFVSPEEHTIIKDWHQKLRAYKEPNGETYNHEGILNDREWLDIVEQGRIAKFKLSEILKVYERSILMEVVDLRRY